MITLRKKLDDNHTQIEFIKTRNIKKSNFMDHTHTNTYLSHKRIVHDPIIHNDTNTTIKQVPGQMVINVFNTKRVLKLIRFNAPILRDEASVNNLLCNNITRHIR